MSKTQNNPTANYSSAAPLARGHLAAVVVAAIVMGLPTLRGTFVGGDDHRLVLNHVLVNHPSWPHAVELFKIVHRDLYQPIPLLSFSGEFAVARALGLFDESLAGGAWLFHLTNMLLHAVNSALVWFLIRTLSTASEFARSKARGSAGASARAETLGSLEPAADRGLWIATIAALLFAIHPLQAEVVAWVNGRMMLLSTLFALASLLTVAAYLRSGRLRWAIGTAFFVLLCMISKVRLGLPLLLLIPLFQIGMGPKRLRSSGRRWGFVALWLVCAALTACFVLVNVEATARSGLFERAALQFHGPRAVRVMLALAWYLEHFVWPSGLASWYPSPEVVRLTAAATLRASLILAAASVVIGWVCLRRREALWGVVWFAVTIASTLPIVPARNMLAADRYMYLPIVGLLWLTATAVYAGFQRVSSGWSTLFRRVVAMIGGTAVVAVLVLASWHTGSFYVSSIQKTQRIAQLFPTTPHVWARVGWSYHKAGVAADLAGDSELATSRHEKSIRCGRRELKLEDSGGWSEGLQVIGLSQLKLGRADDAIESLKRAVEITSDTEQANFRLALAYEELGRYDEALPLYESAVENAPGNNPTVLRLARLYRHFGRANDARSAYEQALRNNAYEVPATLGLAELDIDRATPDSYRAAQQRLFALLDWMPENTAAWIDLGVVRQALGRTDEAIEAYKQVLAINPDDGIAALNLAQLYAAGGDTTRAWPLFDRAAASRLESTEHVVAVHDFYIAQQEADRAAGLWSAYVSRVPDSSEARLFHAWSLALAERFEQARSLVSSAVDMIHPTERQAEPPMALATLAYVALAQGRYDVAAAKTESLAALGEKKSADARRRLRHALDRFFGEHPNAAWTFCLSARLLIADHRQSSAVLGIDLCEKLCDDGACREYVESLRARTRDTH